ncbi:MAG: DUF1501 domain-containing protein [Pirellulales bacterium]
MPQGSRRAQAADQVSSVPHRAGRAMPLGRRDLLRIGSLGVSASVWPGPSSQAGEAALESSGTARSVIFLWMAGGVTHLDSFDPKPEAPEQVRGTLSAIATSMPGLHFAETLPNLARQVDKFALVRSFSHDNNDHFMSQAWSLSGRKVSMEQILTEPNIGSIVAHLRGPRNQLPGYIAVPGITRPGPPPTNEFVGGWLGNQYAPFCVGGEPEQPDFTVGEKSENPSPLANEDLLPQALGFAEGLDVDRLAHRSQLRMALERALGDAEKAGAMDGHYRGAFHLLASPAVRAAFDLSGEPGQVRNDYGRTKLGGRCLLARRLVEAGARFVMVDYGYDPEYGNLWDNHAVPVQKQPHISEMAKRGYHVAGLDKAFAALLCDLSERGLLDSTLVVFMTEFGRTPKINADGGRDHWGPAGSIFFAGGGVRGGQVIGATDRQAAYPLGRGYTPGDVAATIYRALGIDAAGRIHDRQNRPHFVLPEGEAIEGIFA